MTNLPWAVPRKIPRSASRRNPWDTARIPGGSSGGSAASVAADEVIARSAPIPAASIRSGGLCGCVGMKPTYGRVSRYGLSGVCVVA